MSKKSYKTEEAPPLKKSIIRKVEKQYGKDNPKTYATLLKIYKDKKKNEDAPANSNELARLYQNRLANFSETILWDGDSNLVL